MLNSRSSHTDRKAAAAAAATAAAAAATAAAFAVACGLNLPNMTIHKQQ